MVQVINFGCRLNAYEGEIIRRAANEAGLQDAIVINSCAVTAEAERQVRQAIRKARKENPQARIVVTGCAAQISPDDYTAMEEVDHVLGNAEKIKKQSYVNMLAPQEEKARVNDIMSVRETAGHMAAGLEGKARAFVQVQNGCDHRCTFCIIPFGRGPSRSVPAGEVVEEVRALAAAGYKEVVLTGVDITDYGKNLPGAPTLGNLARRILKLAPELPRLRLSSIDAAEMDDELFALLADEPRFMPHLHVSVQAGDDMVLKRMKRRHSRKDILDFCARARALRPDIAFGADLIAGFPTEDETMFQNTLALVEEAGLTWLHVFPYSARKGTPAARMPQVPKELRKERAARLRTAGEKQKEIFLRSQIGKTVQVLMEKENLGRTEHFAEAEISDAPIPGHILTAQVTSISGARLIAEAA